MPARVNSAGSARNHTLSFLRQHAIRSSYDIALPVMTQYEESCVGLRRNRDNSTVEVHISNSSRSSVEIVAVLLLAQVVLVEVVVVIAVLS